MKLIASNLDPLMTFHFLQVLRKSQINIHGERIGKQPFPAMTVASDGRILSHGCVVTTDVDSIALTIKLLSACTNLMKL